MNLWTRILGAFTRHKPGEQRVYLSTRQAGVVVTEDTAMTLPEWWACVSVLSRTIASLPWGVFERTTAGRQRKEGTISWLLNNQPNPEMTAFSFRETLIAHALNWGNGYAEIEVDLSNRPLALWLITPDRVCPERDETSGRLQYRVTNADGTAIFIPPERMLHLHGLGFDGLVGYSIPRMAARSIGIGIAQDVFGQAFYQNGTAFGGVLEVPAKMSPQQVIDQENYLNDKHRGPDKAFGVKVLPEGAKITNIGMPLQDAQFIESRGLSITTAARWLGVPPHKIADLSRSTNNNIEHQGIEFVTDAIVPWTMRLEQEANIKLFGARSMGRVYTKLNVNALMRGDSKARAEFYRAMVQMGVLTINEVRELEDMNGIGPDGDERLVQLNQTTLTRLVEGDVPGAAAEPPAPAAAPEDHPEDPPQRQAPPPSNVIRAEALQFLRARR